jgi:hypothetical protein
MILLGFIFSVYIITRVKHYLRLSHTVSYGYVSLPGTAFCLPYLVFDMFGLLYHTCQELPNVFLQARFLLNFKATNNYMSLSK